MVQKLSKFLLANDLRASLVALTLVLAGMIAPFFAWLALILLAYMMLEKGVRTAFSVIAFIALPAISLAYLHSYGWSDVFLLMACFVFFLAWLTRSDHWHLNRLLYLPLILGGFTVIAVLWVHPQWAHEWQQLMVPVMQKSIQQWQTMSSQSMMGFPSNVQQLKEISLVMFGLIVFLIPTVISFSVVAYAKYLRFKQHRPSTEHFTEFTSLSVHRGYVLLWMVFVCLLIVKAHTLSPLLPVTLLPFLMVGLSIVAAFNRLRQAINIFCCLLLISLLATSLSVYFPLILLQLVFFLGFLGLILLGFFDVFFNFRHLVVKRRSSQTTNK